MASDPTQSDLEGAQLLSSLRDRIDALAARGKFRQALSMATDAVDQLEGADLRGAALIECADLCLDLDELQRAKDYAERALEAGYTAVDAYSVLGWIEYGLDNIEAAERTFSKGLERDSSHVSSLLGRGLALLELGRLERAESELSYALNTEPDDPDLYATRAEIRIVRHNLEQARSDLDKARQLAPGDQSHLVDHVRTHILCNEYDNAYTELGRAVCSTDEKPLLESLLLKSWLSAQKGRWHEAKREAIRAVHWYPESAFALTQLSGIARQTGAQKLARRTAEQAVTMDPSLPDAYLVRAAIKKEVDGPAAGGDDLERGRKAAPELPLFLLGSCFDHPLAESVKSEIVTELLSLPSDSTETDESESGSDWVKDFADRDTATEGFDFDFGKDLGSKNPLDAFKEAFDDSGQLKPEFKPMIQMLIDNAPGILNNLPSGLFKNLGVEDEEKLDNIDFSQLSAEEVEQRLQTLYQMLESGHFNGDGFPDGFPNFDPENPGDT